MHLYDKNTSEHRLNTFQKTYSIGLESSEGLVRK